MKNTLATFVGVALMAAGCTTLEHNADPVAVRAEQTLAVALGIVDTALKFEHTHDNIPKEVSKVADEVRKKAADAFVSADRIRVAYKNGTASGSQLIAALDVVNSIVGEVRWWVQKSSAGNTDYVYVTIKEAEASQTPTSSSWLAAVPMFIDLGKSVYSVVLDIRKSLSQSKQWTVDEDKAFRTKLLKTVTQDHWK